MGRTVYCANCGKQLDSDYASTFVGEPGYYCGSSCLREFQKKHAANAESYKSYTDMFGNKVRIVGSTGEFEVKTGFWGWTTASFKGKVEYRYPNGDLYVGEVHGQSFNGKGKMFWKSTGNTYEGDWVYDYRTGKGRFTWADGTYHEGDFVRGKYEGYGIHIYTDGYKYEGQFKDGKRHGKGVLTAPDGTAVEYYYENDKKICKVSEATDEIVARIYGSAPKEVIDTPAVEKKTTIATEVKKAADTSTVKKAEVAAPADQPPKLVEESFEGLSDQEIWDRLLKMNTDEKKSYFEKHHELTVPEGTEKIPDGMFQYCGGLQTIHFNTDLSEIGESAFCFCSGLEPVLVIPKNIKKICKRAFDICQSVKKLVLPNNVTVEKYAFGHMRILSEVEFESDPPVGVVLDAGAFSDCDNYKHLTKEARKKLKAVNKKVFKI